MGDVHLRDGNQKLISYSDDLVGVLKNARDLSNLSQYLEGADMLQLYSDQDALEVQNSVKDVQNNINECQRRIGEAKREVIPDADLDSLQKELEEQLQKEHLLQEELRILSNDINDLECQRVSVEERKKTLKKAQINELREQRKLSMYASVTNIIPNLDDPTEISGYIVERNKKVVTKFNFEQSNAFPDEICNKLWKMINQ
ncbi:hypothetical protein Syun_000034 [Stephania yunnanensis]|uniref:Kinetochore protein Spc24 n=1 Tax=Stephania yunnanensis TaxID=152371 RepID=A0AAP0LF67_9MAGN